MADAHAGAADPGVGTFNYLFTWASPAFDGVLGSCHALEIPFVFGTLKNEAIQAFSGGGEDAFALSLAMRRSWTSFARTGVPVCDLPGAGSLTWASWDSGTRPTTVLGPWPGVSGLVHPIDDPRSAELDAVGSVTPPLTGHRST
jgi:para-nitrobenzyl esterase